MNNNAAASLDTGLLEQAADWAMLFQYDKASVEQHQEFENWHLQSRAHQAAWQQAQNVFQTFDQVPTPISKQVLNKLDDRHDRRQALKLLGVFALALPTAWLAARQAPWQQWTADIATATGEHKTINLPDGSQLVLNTNSAVNIVFGLVQRRVQLVEGEILITTHADPAPTARPFLVDTPFGVVRALGTRFSVRKLNNQICRVAVFESAVEIRTLSGASHILQAGQQADFSAVSIQQPKQVETSAALWQQGMFLAKDMRLEDLLIELDRYRPGILRCDPAVANLLVSGAILLNDTDASLNLLEKNLPIQISRISRYWVTVKAPTQ